MEAILLNQSLERIGVIDTFESFLWIDKYDLCGEFEIILAPTVPILLKVLSASYISIIESEHLMLIDWIGIKSESEKGSRLIIKGNSIEFLLDRRIIMSPLVLSGNFQTAIQGILNANFISPSDTDRTISLIEFQASSDPVITALTVDTQYLGNSCYEVITNLCYSFGIGFKMTLTTAGKFRFELYSGTDRSYSQSTNPYIVFSPNFDNLLNAQYITTNRELKTVAVVAGEYGIGNERLLFDVPLPSGGGTGLNRRELFVNASDITITTPEGTLTAAEYVDKLYSKGYEALAKNSAIQSFDGEVDDTLYEFGVDYNMGDILQIANEFGNEGRSRITEMVYFQDEGNIKRNPTFSKV